MCKLRKVLLLTPFLVFIAACAETQLAVHTVKEMGPSAPAGGKGNYKVGKPYQVAGTWYYPKEDFNYDETGIASWYGPGFHGKSTANGEVFDQFAVSAAHRTLPLPSAVRVTNLENGRAINLRVNDRGPFSKNRIIDLSRKAAQLLGFEGKGTARVRVEILPAESRRMAAIAQGKEVDSATAPAVPRETVVAEVLTDTPGVSVSASTTPKTVQAARLPSTITVKNDSSIVQLPVQPTEIFVQVGAFGQMHNAIRLGARLNSIGASRITQAKVGGARIYRVRLGPLATVGDADRLLATLDANGYRDAQIIVE
jgi:rare lipoprotein A